MTSSNLSPKTAASFTHYRSIRWIQEGLLQNPREMIRQGNDAGFGPKVRVTSQKSELQTKSESYSRGEPQNPNRIAQKRTWMAFRGFYRKPPLKPSFRKILVSVNFFACNSGAGNSHVFFYWRLEEVRSFCRRTFMPIKYLV